jgi:1-acyl-sn-glycerol-3-phosphate acyltransferase
MNRSPIHAGGLPERRLEFVRRRAYGFFHRRWEIYERGAENVPETGPVIFASNHIGWLDGPLLVATAPRTVHAMGKAEEFTGKMGKFLTAIGQIKVNRDRTDAAALRAALGALGAGQTVLVYPEGTRTDGEINQFKNGVAYLALRTGAPIVPIALFGTREAGEPSDARPPRGRRIDVVYGEPIVFPMRAWPRDRGMIDDAGRQIRDHLRAHISRAKTALNRDLPGPLPTGTIDG